MNQLLAFDNDLAGEAQFASFQGAEAAEHAGRSAGCAGGEVILLHQQRALAGAGTLACDGNAHEATAYDGDLEVLADRERRVLRLDLGHDVEGGLELLAQAVERSLG